MASGLEVQNGDEAAVEDLAKASLDVVRLRSGDAWSSFS
jgi:hypothetical protein